jgi:hypothetical protein
MNTYPNEISKGYCEECSDEAISNKNEIAAPFGVAMTVIILPSFVLNARAEEIGVNIRPERIDFFHILEFLIL